MSTTWCGDYYRYREGKCESRQTNSVFYFVTSVVALLILTSVVLFCVCCVCLRRRRLWAAVNTGRGRTLGPGPGPALGSNPANVTYVGDVSVTDYQSEMEQGRLRGIPSQKKNPGVAVIMPGETEVTFIAEPSSPVRVSVKEKSHLDSSPDESSGSFLIPHPPKHS